MRLTRLKTVVLPAPFGPMIVNTSPGSTAKLTPSRARTPPKLIARSSAASRPPAVIRGCLRLLRARGRWASSRRRSSEPLRAHVRLLPLERGALVQGKDREVDLELHPAAVDAERLEQDEQREDQAEHAGLERGLLHEAIGRLRHRFADTGAEQAEGRAEPARQGIP